MSTQSDQQDLSTNTKGISNTGDSFGSISGRGNLNIPDILGPWVQEMSTNPQQIMEMLHRAERFCSISRDSELAKVWLVYKFKRFLDPKIVNSNNSLEEVKAAVSALMFKGKAMVEIAAMLPTAGMGDETLYAASEEIDAILAAIPQDRWQEAIGMAMLLNRMTGHIQEKVREKLRLKPNMTQFEMLEEFSRLKEVAKTQKQVNKVNAATASAAAAQVTMEQEESEDAEKSVAAMSKAKDTQKKTAEKEKPWNRTVKCYKCEGFGHLAKECPSPGNHQKSGKD